ncbi:MAG: hypothetical protein K8I82_30825 [Anaerolineae bacterium]|nr:hypothetical protein [Anaerolineae bacterium]
MSVLFGGVLILVSGLLSFWRTNESFYLLAFLSNRDGNAEFFRMLPDGRGLTQLTFTTPPLNDSHGHCDLAWMPDRFHLITSYGSNYEPGDFFCYHDYGKHFRLDVISGKMSPFEYQEKPLVWSPDAQWKLFIEPVRLVGRVAYELYRVQPGNKNKRVIASLTNWRNTPVQWSESWIVYMDDPNVDYRNEIYRLHPDGSSNQRLIPLSERTIFCDQLTIAGTWLLFGVQDSSGNCTRLYRTPINEPHFIMHKDLVTELTTPIDYNARLIASPDGKQAAFWDISGSIFVISVETGRLYPVAHARTYYPAMLTLDWSPDSQWLVFTSCEEFCKIYRVRPDGISLQMLTSGAGDDVFPTYSPEVSFAWKWHLFLGVGTACLLLGLPWKFFRSQITHYLPVRTPDI